MQEVQRTVPVSLATQNGDPGPSPFSPPRLSIIVLPFANLGGNAAQHHFVDGVTESLTTDLSRIDGSFVIGRHTAFAYKDKAADLKQIGRELNVRYILKGSVQRAGNQLRVNVRLVDAQDGNHIWADRFDKPVANLFDIMVIDRRCGQNDPTAVPMAITAASAATEFTIPTMMMSR